MDPLRLVGTAVLCGALGFMAGCLYGKADAGEEAGNLKARIDTANANLDNCASSLVSLRGHFADELAKAEEQADAATLALETVMRENLDLASKASALERQMALARQEPTCRDQLEVELCPSVPLL